MKLLFLATITVLTNLDLGVLSYEQYCLRDEQKDKWDNKQTPTIPSGVTTNKPDVPTRSRMDAQLVYTSLVRGIEELPFIHHAQAGRLQLTCEDTVPVVASPSGHVVIAAAQYGKGRVVAVAHEKYIQNVASEPQFGRFVRNAIDWLSPHPDALVGVYRLPRLTDFLAAEGIKVRNVPGYDRAVGVFCCDAYSDKMANELLQFVKGGGGLLIGGQAWHWSHEHPGEDVLLSFPGNKVIRDTGIVFVAKASKKGVYKVPKEIPRAFDARLRNKCSIDA